MNQRPGETIIIEGVPLRRDPAREKCFIVVYRHAERPLVDGMSERAQLEKLHLEFNSELVSLEIAAQCLSDFPDAPWELRMQLARQCWDEMRHARLCYQRYVEKGGRKGDFPIINMEWCVVCMLDSLPARLAVQNRTFEAGSMDAFRTMIDWWREAGDEQASEIMETILADEVQHVRFANQWLKLMSEENPRILLKVAEAMAYLKRVREALTTQAGELETGGRSARQAEHGIPVSTEDRREADFTEQEIAKHLGEEALLA